MMALALSYLLIGAGIFVAAVSWQPRGLRALLMYSFSTVFFSAFLLEFILPSAGRALGFIGAGAISLVVIAFSRGSMGAWTGAYILTLMAAAVISLWRGTWCLFPFTGLLFGTATLWGVKVGAILHWEHRNVLALSAALFFLSTALYALDRPLTSGNVFFSGTLLGILQLFEGAEILKNIRNRRRLFNRAATGRISAGYRRD